MSEFIKKAWGKQLEQFYKGKLWASKLVAIDTIRQQPFFGPYTPKKIDTVKIGRTR